MAHSLRKPFMMKLFIFALTYFSIVPTWETTNFSKLDNYLHKSNYLTWDDSEHSNIIGMMEVIGKRLKVVIKTSDAGLENVAGGTLTLPNGTVVYLDGSGIPVLWDLRDSLDLKLDIELVNNWREVWTKVADGDADLGSSLVTIQPNLLSRGAYDTVIMLHPLVTMPSLVYFRQSSNEVLRLFHLEPLKKDAWFGFSFCWTLCVLMCHVIHRLPPLGENLKWNHNFIRQFSISEALLWSATISSGKDYPANFRDPGTYQVSLRIAMLAAIHLSVIATSIYTAKIVVVFSKESNLIHKPEDLLKFGYELGSWSEIHLDRIFHGINLGTARRDAAINDVVNNSRETTMKKVLGIGNPNLRYAYLTHPDGYFFHDPKLQGYQTQLCKISSFSSAVKSPRAMYVKKGSALRGALNWKSLQIMERGLNGRYQRTNLQLYEHTCHHKSIDTLEELDLPHTFFIFVILIVGISAALIIVFCEYIYDKIHFQQMYNMSHYILRKL